MEDFSSTKTLSSAMLEISLCTWTMPWNNISALAGPHLVALNLLVEMHKHAVSGSGGKDSTFVLDNAVYM